MTSHDLGGSIRIKNQMDNVICKSERNYDKFICMNSIELQKHK